MKVTVAYNKPGLALCCFRLGVNEQMLREYHNYVYAIVNRIIVIYQEGGVLLEGSHKTICLFYKQLCAM